MILAPAKINTIRNKINFEKENKKRDLKSTGKARIRKKVT